jgi:membrane fusion protein, multidrug efflux system
MSEPLPKALVAVRRTTRIVLLMVLPLVVILAGFYYYARGGRLMETENAYVKANIIAVSSEVSGRVAEVGVHDNEPVAAGVTLFRLEQKPFLIELNKAQAQMDVVRTEVQALRAEYRSKRSQGAHRLPHQAIRPSGAVEAERHEPRGSVRRSAP